MTREIVMAPDTARARRSDPLPSHVAADVSASTKQLVSERVFAIVATHGPLNGNEINDLYMLTASRNDWDNVHFDTPRKRAGDLAADGFLVITNEGCKRGTPHIYMTPAMETNT